MRGLGPTKEVVPLFMTREELSDSLVEELDEDIEDILKAQDVYKILGLIPQNADLRQLLLDLYTEQVAGFYDSETEELYLIVGADEEGLSPLDEITLAHEFTHAIQQQRFDIQAMLEAVEDNSDASSALVALVEGDASATQFRYVFTNFTREQQMEALVGSGDVDTSALDSTPYILQQSLAFPYVQGLAFVSALFSGPSDWDAVNEAYNDPPTSTEQVLHPEKYIERDAPVPVSLLDVAAALGEGWENVYSDVMGEFLLKTYLETRTTTITAADAAAGWGGDRFALLRGPGCENALVALLVWDTGKDAKEFLDAMAASDSVPSDGFLGLKDNRMLWVLSPSEQLTDRVRALWPEF